MNLPLPLELTKPVPMAADLDMVLAANRGVATYDPQTQLCCGGGGGHNTSSKCVNYGFLQVDDILQDFSIDL